MKKVIWACALALAALPAWGQEVLQFTAGTNLNWDDNVFRLADGADPQSDRFSSSYVGVRFDKAYVQQRFLLDLRLTAYRYDRFSHLDFNATQYSAVWDWRLSNTLSGSLSADRSQSLVNYADFREPGQRNVRTAENRALNVDANLTHGWRITSALLQQESRNSVPFPQERGFRAAGGHLGPKYVAGSGSSISLVQRWLGGDYVERALDPATLTDDGFRRVETEALVSWIVSARSGLEARLAHIDYESNNFAQRDFSGAAGRVGWRWTPGARLTLGLSAGRDVFPSSDAFAYHVENRFSVDASWEFAARTALKASAFRGDSEFRQPVLAIAGPPREERLTGWQLGADWRVHRNATLTASLNRQKRESNDPAFDFHGTTVTLGATLTY